MGLEPGRQQVRRVGHPHVQGPLPGQLHQDPGGCRHPEKMQNTKHLKVFCFRLIFVYSRITRRDNNEGYVCMIRISDKATDWR